MNNNLTVLMYHAITNSSGALVGADPHYAVSRSTFRRHLELVGGMGFRATSVARLVAAKIGAPEGNLADADTGKIAFTFDDGHESNADAASDLLAVSGSADLFINSSMVGKRNYLDWNALSDLAEAGISIQSHGHSHRYFDELSESEINIELATSKSEIEDHLGFAVTLFAPPGGRITRKVHGIAQKLGYCGICNSRVGVWKNGASAWEIPRLAVLSTTPDAQFSRWLRQDNAELAKLKIRHHLLAGAKSMLGNKGYESLRTRLLGRSAASAESDNHVT